MTRNETDSNVKQIEKVLPEKHTNMLLIVDDLPQVWDKYASQTVNVLPFHFWKDVAGPVEGRVPAQTPSREGEKSESCEEDGEAPLQSPPISPTVTWTNENDCYLFFLGPVLNTLHQIFYQFETISTKQVR